MAADQLSKNNPDGTVLGQSANDKIAFYGTAPVARQTLACVPTGCALATVLSKLNSLINILKASYGMLT